MICPFPLIRRFALRGISGASITVCPEKRPKGEETAAERLSPRTAASSSNHEKFFVDAKNFSRILYSLYTNLYPTPNTVSI